MNVDCLIVGQGICGSFLSWYLEKEKLSFLILDESISGSATKAAAGIINPVTGRRLVKTWMIDELLPFALTAYQSIGAELSISCISEQTIIDFFPTAQMRLAFLERHAEDAQYLGMPVNEHFWNDLFRYDLGFGEINPAYLVDTNLLLNTYRKKISAAGKLRQEKFNISELTVNDKDIVYQDVQAKQIIFCDGIQSTTNPYFSLLPFAPNKGEALIVQIPLLPRDHIYKRGMTIAPWKDDLFWVGSSYQWSFDHEQTTDAFRERTVTALNDWLKIPFTMVDHIVSIRPATLERRPFAGFHPTKKNVGILNGMGTKGCSLAPYFASQLAHAIRHQTNISPEADIKRFNNILSKHFSIGKRD